MGEEEHGGDELHGSPEMGGSGGWLRRVLDGVGFSGEVFFITHFFMSSFIFWIFSGCGGGRPFPVRIFWRGDGGGVGEVGI